MTISRSRNRKRGAIFVVTLAILAGLIAILTSVATTHRTMARATTNRMETTRAKMVAQSALQYAIATLANAASGATAGGTSSTANSSTMTTLQDDWAVLGSNGSENFAIGNIQFRIQIVDALSKININNATQAQLQQMNLTDEQVDSLMDFREAGTNPRPLGGKDEYYNSLTNGYNAKLRSLDTIDELLNVKGFTAKDIFELQTNVVNSGTSTANRPQKPLSELITAYGYAPVIDSQGQAKVNVNAAGTNVQRLQQLGFQVAVAQTIANSKNWRNLGQLCQQFGNNPAVLRLILDELTVGGGTRVQGKLNLNTVTGDVLDAIPELTPDIVQGILSQQQQGFTTLSDITKVPGLTNGTTLQAVADLFTVVSQTYIVRILGQSGNFTYAMEATIDVQNGTPKIIRITDAPFSNMADRWGWDAPQTGNLTTILEAK